MAAINNVFRVKANGIIGKDGTNYQWLIEEQRRLLDKYKESAHTDFMVNACLVPAEKIQREIRKHVRVAQR